MHWSSSENIYQKEKCKMKRTRNKLLRIRLTEEEYNLIKAKAVEAGMSRTAFILHATEQHSTNVVGDGIMSTYKELHKQGANLNQAVRYIYDMDSVPEGFSQLIEDNIVATKMVRNFIDTIGRIKR